MFRGKLLGQAGTAGATLLLTTFGALAQEGVLDAPYQVTLDLKTAFVADTNELLSFSSSDTSYSVQQTVGFGLSTSTSTQQFRFASSGTAKLSSASNHDVQFTQPNANLSYAREGANSSLTFSASYQQANVADSYLIADPLDPTIFDSIVDSGTFHSLSGKAALRTGIDAPFGLGVTASYNDITYFNITNPDIYDRTTWTTGVTAYLQYSPVTSGTVGVDYEDYTAQNLTNTHRETTTYSVGVAHQLARGLTLSGNIGYRTEDTTDLGVTVTDSNSFAGLSASQAMPNGSLTGSVNVGNQASGEDYALSIGRSLELPSGSLSAVLSATKFPTGGLQYSGNVNYLHELSDGNVNMSLNQVFQQSDTNDVFRVTDASVGYQQQVTETSSLNLGLSLNQSTDLTGAQPTTSLAKLSATYSYALTSDWNLSLGYSHRRSVKESAGTANSDSISVSLSRALAFGF